MRKIIRLLVTASIGVSGATGATAQTTPVPSAPPVIVPQSKESGGTMVINPTDEECKQGWNSNLKWTRAEFEQFCTTLRTSK